MKRLLKRLTALGGIGALVAALFVGLTALPAAANYTGIDCTTAYLDPHRPLVNGDHINIDVVQGNSKFQVNAYVDRNIPGGWETFGLRLKTPGGEVTVPLTESEVKDPLRFNYGKYLSGAFTVEWAQFNEGPYFNPTRDPAKFLTCGEPPVVPEKPADKSGTEPRTLPPVCVEPADGTATVEHQERTWTQTHNLVDNKWVLGEKVYSDWKTVKTDTVDSEDCEPVIPEQPDDKVVTTAWVDGEYDCADTTVTQTRTVSTTPFVLVKNEWVPGETVTITETQTRDLTEDERKLYQGDNPEGECYVEVPETETETWIEFAVGCETQIGDVIPAVEYTRTVEHDLDPVTGDVTARDNVTTRDFDYTVQPEDLGSVEDCEVPPTEPPVTPEEPTPTPTPTTPPVGTDTPDEDEDEGTPVTGQRTGGPTLPRTGSQFPWAALLLGGGLTGVGIYAVTRRKASA